MRPERWEQVEQLYHAARARTGGERSAFLDAACAGDAALRREVESLLAQQTTAADGLLDRPAWASLLDEPSVALLALGSQLGPYQILSLLGTGGMGQVYKAFDARLRREVAIKVAGERFSERFDREVRAIAALNHPNICTVHDVGPNYLVMELVDGETLREWFRRGLPLERSLGIARQVLEALSAAHRTGVIHRDLKPENVMVRVDGYVKVLDFGLAKWLPTALRQTGRTATMGVSQPGQILGTFAYMSPEQIQGQDVDQRSDLFAFGILLYEMLTGRHPWPRPSSVETLHAILHDDPPPIDAPHVGVDLPATALERIVRRCLAKQPGQRFQTMGELRAALEQAATELTPKPTEHQPSIAVLPFANMSADKENEYFSDGLAEEIINVLAHVPGLKVAGRTSSFFFRGKDVEFGEIGRRLNVEHILEGSVRKAGSRIRVTAQLIKVTDGFHLWSERYDREMTDIFTIQDEITQAIAAALRTKLSPEAATLRRHPANLRAYEAYLKARDYWFKPTPESLARFKESLEHAIELDPEFALAHSLLGGYYTMLAALGLRPAREVIPLARAAELEALRIEPSLPEAHAMLGVCDGGGYEWNQAERRWRLAMAREPVSRDIRFWYGNHYLLPIGRPVEAVEAMEWGLQQDPLNLLYRHHLAVGLRHAGRPEDAEAELRKVLEIDENFPLALGTLGAVCAQQGRFGEALTLTERVYALTPWASPIVGQLAALLVRAGATSRADALIEKLRLGKTCGAPAGLAVFHAMCGEFDRAAEWAEQAIEERYPPLVRILQPLLRSSPRWPALAKLMNLPG
jgi:eukaryotic-like serine/threonine-protein kinase